MNSRVPRAPREAKAHAKTEKSILTDHLTSKVAIVPNAQHPAVAVDEDVPVAVVVVVAAAVSVVGAAAAVVEAAAAVVVVVVVVAEAVVAVAVADVNRGSLFEFNQ